MPDVPSVATVQAVLAGEVLTFRCPPEATLLEAAIEAGLLIPHSCRQGHCGACVVRLTSGTVTSTPGSALSRRDRLEGRILACQSRPTSSSIRLDYDA